MISHKHISRAWEEFRFVSMKRSHALARRIDSKRLKPRRVWLFLASFGFVLTHFSGTFADSMGLSGFVLLNFRFFFFGF
jgi:hypothetical protein